MSLHENEYVLGVYADVILQSRQLLYPVNVGPHGAKIALHQGSHTGTLIMTTQRVFFSTKEYIVLGLLVRNMYHVVVQLEQATPFVQIQFFTPHSIQLAMEKTRAVDFLQHLHSLQGPEMLPVAPQLCRFLWKPDDFDRVLLAPPINTKNSAAQQNESVIYTLAHPFLSPNWAPIPLPSGHWLFNPLREFKRMGVRIDTPPRHKIAEMVFGDEIHPELLSFLLTARPAFDRAAYAAAAATLTQKTFGQLHYFDSRWTHDVQQMYQNLATSFFYDPRSLFQTDQQFYELLQSHPQAILADYGREQFGHHGDEGRELVERDEGLDEDDMDEEERKEKANLIKALFKSKSAREEVKKKDKDDVAAVADNIDFTAACYCHGSCFKPTYFRVNMTMRAHLVSLIEKNQVFDEDEHSDAVYFDSNIPSTDFRVSLINTNYEHSPTYPCLIGVPMAINDDTIVQAMRFRSRGRIAAISWVSPWTGVSITRCSQPGRGFGLGRDAADEQLLAEICNCGNAKWGQRFLMVYDARPKLSAIGNRLAGKGYESSKAYPMCKTYYCCIENIHVIRDSWESMHKVAMQFKETQRQVLRTRYSVDDIRQLGDTIERQTNNRLEFWDVVAKTKWFTHLQTILCAANQIAQTVAKMRQHVTIHCSDGWDRTSQLSSLSMLLLDPYYRTIRGFAILIEKEWLSYGHMVATRNRTTGSTRAARKKENEYFRPSAEGGGLQFKMSDQPLKYDELCCSTGIKPKKQQAWRFSNSQTSPIFQQFIECVYQLLVQFPTHFEFNTQFLLYILQELYNGRNGTFVFDNEQQRTQFCVQMAMKSSFDVLLDPQRVAHFLNRSYQLPGPLHTISQRQLGETCLQCRCGLGDLRLFEEFWLAGD